MGKFFFSAESSSSLRLSHEVDRVKCSNREEGAPTSYVPKLTCFVTSRLEDQRERAILRAGGDKLQKPTGDGHPGVRCAGFLSHP